MGGRIGGAALSSDVIVVGSRAAGTAPPGNPGRLVGTRGLVSLTAGRLGARPCRSWS
ncbi:MAG TPA: hypothetical protein VK453_22150 [Micromonosporaceae bacterium]|nr:hypothetical protein [Micromonosporaceae bacterium]